MTCSGPGNTSEQVASLTCSHSQTRSGNRSKRGTGPVPELTALELRALEAIRAAGGELDAHGLKAAGVTASAMQAGGLLLDLQRAGLLERTARGWKLSAEGER